MYEGGKEGKMETVKEVADDKCLALVVQSLSGGVPYGSMFAAKPFFS